MGQEKWFSHSGVVFSADSEVRHEITSHNNATWMNCCSATTVLYDKYITGRLKSNKYYNVVQFVGLYGSANSEVSSNSDRRFANMEEKMLHWINDITSCDYIWNKDIYDRYGIKSIVEKLGKKCFRYSYIISRDYSSLIEISLAIQTDKDDLNTSRNSNDLTSFFDLKTSR